MNHVDIRPYLEQNYEELKRACLDNGTLFEDNHFPATKESLAQFAKIPKGVEWKRAKDLVNDPKFIIENGKKLHSGDVTQGELADCWFLAAVAVLSNIPELFKDVVPRDQSFDDGDYCGIFHFRFWRYGEWIDVVVDDYLPVDAEGELIYARNHETVFWVPLIEKAYAKLNGSYEFLEWGESNDALVDMTGGVQEYVMLRKVDVGQEGRNTKKDPEALWRFALKTLELHSLFGASIDEENQEKVENFGLVVNHAYSVTKFVTLHDGTRLVRVRNPYGDDSEWTGPWSDESNEWKSITNSEKKRIGLVFDDDGEFFMTWDDFIEYFDTLEIVHVNLNGFFKNFVNKKSLDWEPYQYFGHWIVSESSGGDDYEQDEYWTNPQYVFRIDESDSSRVLISALMQIGSREERANTGGEQAEKYIKIDVFKVINNEIATNNEENDGTPKFTYDQLELIDCTESTNLREIVKRISLETGTYVIVPCTSTVDDEGSFLLRVFIEN